MGASFRSVDQVLGLAGCDLLTVSPNLLSDLSQDEREVKAQLSAAEALQQATIENTVLDKDSFKVDIEKDLMASQLLLSGIDGFIKARQQLNLLLRQSFGFDAEIEA